MSRYSSYFMQPIHCSKFYLMGPAWVLNWETGYGSAAGQTEDRSGLKEQAVRHTYVICASSHCLFICVNAMDLSHFESRL